MPEWIKWFFDGLGSQLIGLAIGSILGGITGFHIGKHKSKFIQQQDGGIESEQYQNGSSQHKNNNDKSEDVVVSFTQKQTAGNKSKQTQIGRQDDV